MRVIDKTVQAAVLSLPGPFLGTGLMRLFALTKIPLLLFCSPSVKEWADDACAVGIALRRRTRNHLKSMYFGTLAVGADMAAGLLVQRHIMKSRRPLGLIFKGVEATFLRRATGDVTFRSDQGVVVAALVRRAIALGHRVEDTVDVVATTSDGLVAAHFRLLISLKLKHL